MSGPIARLNAALEGRYRVERQLGEGGMATVYLARDEKHNRKVALKVLKPELAAVVGAERFLAEIEMTANLQHPHILPLFDSGEAGGFLFYVMPYVEGESLRERLDREHQLPVDEAVEIARNVAEALDYAHSQGVIHRDIKPANILLQAGKPMISDFGIALAVGVAGGGRLTETGLSLGTPHYMSPEQATGDLSVGAATDIYALGCVLYEMLVGEPPYTGSTPQAILGKIISGDAASARKQRRSVPPNVDGAISKALEKVPADRFHAAQEMVKAVADPTFRHDEGAGAGPSELGIQRGDRVTIGLAAVTLTLAGVAAWGWLKSPDPLPLAPPLRTALSGIEVIAPVGSGTRLAISRDGSRLAIASVVDGVSRLFVRPSDQVEFREIPDTEGARSPSFSPDGQWLAFEQGDVINRVEAAGGPVLFVAQGGDPHWGLDTVLVFRRSRDIYRVAPTGGDPVLVLDRNEDQDNPHLLPDGRGVLFTEGTSRDRAVMLVELESGQVIDLGIDGYNPRYVPTGHLVYGHTSEALMAVPFDLATHRVTGSPSTVLPSVEVSQGPVQFDVSETGTAIYALARGGGPQSPLEMVIVDRDRRETLVPLARRAFRVPRFSPSDGRRIAYDGGENQVWVYNLDTGENQLLHGEGDSDYPAAWSRDGQYVYFESSGAGTLDSDVFKKPANGSEPAQHLAPRPVGQYPLSPSPDDQHLLVEEQSDVRGWDLLILIEGQDGPVFTEYLRGDWNEMMGQISPDGEQVVYVSDESGIREVYVRSFPDGTGQRRVSEAGGTEPRWAPDGTAVYYVSYGRIMRAPITAAGVGEPEPLEALDGFWTPTGAATPMANWDIHPDGNSFVFVRDPEGDSSPRTLGEAPLQIEIVTNWFAELGRRMGGN